MNLPGMGPIELSEFQRTLEPDRIYVKGQLRSPGPARVGSVRIVSWNIERGKDPAEIADRLQALRPDIACLQEVDWGNRRTGGSDVLQILAERTGMLGLYGIEFLELEGRERPARYAGGGAVGNALLTRCAPAASFRIELPVTLDWSGAGAAELPPTVRRHLSEEPRTGRRFGIGADFAIGSKSLIVCSLHLEDKLGGIRGRWSQFSAAAGFLRDRPASSAAISVIAGDFNTFDSAASRVFTRETDATALGRPFLATEAGWWKSQLLPTLGYADPFPPKAWTFRIFPVFRAKLDWITANGGIVRDFGTGDAGLSDHRPIWMDLDLG
jgi:endonuclease/exonuclease/phosphatase family metal-dependent hydrolase